MLHSLNFLINYIFHCKPLQAGTPDGDERSKICRPLKHLACVFVAVKIKLVIRLIPYSCLSY